jgi:hypothetical protein
MKKPLHKVAVGLWVVGAAVIVLWGLALFETLRMYAFQTTSFGGLVMGAVAAAVLIALGTIIEIVDQIRWNALPPDQRGGH